MTVPGDDEPTAEDTTSDTTGGTGTRRRSQTDDSEPTSLLHEFRTAETGTLMIIREIATSAGVVLLVGLLLFGASGVWPPMVAIESGSMEPNMYKGDLVFIVDNDRFTSEHAYGDTGIVTYQAGEDAEYTKFGDYGDVIIFQPNKHANVPYIHRARFWVDDGENWYDKANSEYVNADNCQDLRNCPAPHAGFITKGDANHGYDQSMGIADPVKPESITGTAELRVPWLGWVRLTFAEIAVSQSTVTTTEYQESLIEHNISVNNQPSNVGPSAQRAHENQPQSAVAG